MNTPSEATKIFCIGLSKTGTTSLAAALGILGYKVRDNIGVTRYVPGDLSCIDPKELDTHNAFTDTPIPSFYKQLDAKYPDAKFILTIREKDAWLKSCKKQFTQRHAEARNEAVNDLFLDMYGCTYFDEENFTVGYNKFVAGVQEYFQDRPNDLLILDLGDGDEWNKLCQFLGKPVPDIPFPVANVTKIQWMKVEDVIAIAKEAGKHIPSPDSLALSDTNSTKPKGILDHITGKLRGTLIKQRRANLPKVLENAYRTVVEGLKNLNPSIPVLSKKTQDTPYSERKKWSHVWLVDTFDGANALLNGTDAYSINIALVENGAVKMGVVFFPETDTVYFTKEGSASYKQTGSSEPVQLQPDNANNKTLPIVSFSGKTPPEPMPNLDIAHDSNIIKKENAQLALCSVAEGTAKMYIGDTQFMEWEIAAAHAVNKGAKKEIVDSVSKTIIRYNTENLKIISFYGK